MRRPDIRQIYDRAAAGAPLRLRRPQAGHHVALRDRAPPQHAGPGARAHAGARGSTAEFHPHRAGELRCCKTRPTSSTWASTPHGEPVQTSRAVVDADLVIYVDTIQIPLNGGHKSVAVGFGTSDPLIGAPPTTLLMTEDIPDVMQLDGSCMHDSIHAHLPPALQKHGRIMVIEAAMNGATYPAHRGHLAQAAERARQARSRRSCAARLLPRRMKPLPEPWRAGIFRSIRTPSVAALIEINAGAIDPVHARTIAAIGPPARGCRAPARQHPDTPVFGLPGNPVAHSAGRAGQPGAGASATSWDTCSTGSTAGRSSSRAGW